jgi:hypothetical protein
VSRHAIILSVLTLHFGVVQQGLGGLQLRRSVGQPFTVHLVVVDALSPLGQVTRLSHRLVQRALDRRHNGARLA